MSAALKQAAQALKGAISELESVLSAVNEGLIPHDGDEFHERLGAARKARAALEAEQALVALTEEQRRLGMYDEAEPQQEPSAWQVWWGVGDMRPHWPPFKTENDAKDFASMIKSNTEVRPLYSATPQEPDKLDAVDKARKVQP